jgi:glycosyltransferase involved in cell wall biosynthesis
MSNDEPLVSVLIPSFNCATLVADAIDSALAQTWSNTEVIVVDDGSTDDTEAVLSSYGKCIRWERIENSGACVARNRAFELSHGEFVQYLDADDRIVPQKIERQIPHLLGNLSDIVVCNGTLFGDDRPERPIKRVLREPDGEDPFAYCLRNGLSTLGPLIRREYVSRVGGFTPGLRRGQEFEFHLRLAAAGARISFVPELLFSVRMDNRPGKITKNAASLDHQVRMLIDLSEKLQDQPYDLNEARRELLASAILQASVYAYRNGAEADITERGVAVARSLCEKASYPERRWVLFLSSIIGVLNMERLLTRGRRLRKALFGGGQPV